jgi:hypothetical protein
VIEVGTSTRRQISGSVCRSSMSTVAISLKLSDAAFCLAGLMLPIWQAHASNSREQLIRTVDVVIVHTGQHVGQPGRGDRYC